MNYTDALNLMCDKKRLVIKTGLSRIESLLDKMCNPQDKIKVVHIAGTNGKGTVSNIIADALMKCGYKVGLFTSPWITDYREQIQINGNFIPEKTFADYVTEYQNEDATEFEFLTAVMYKYFADEKVDFAVVECGMGGKGDSTNVVKNPELCVITSVSMDHTDFLGSTLDEIAQEKAGIIKDNSTVVLYPNGACESVFENKCKETGSRLIKARDMGDFKSNNLETAGQALAYLRQCVHLEYPKLPARQEYIGDNMMIDGAHNKDGALALRDFLPNKKITAVIGMMKDKDIDSYLKILAPHFEKIITVTVDNPRSISASDLAEIAVKYCNNVEICENPNTAVSLAKQDDNFILICGSFYLARQIRKDLI